MDETSLWAWFLFCSGLPTQRAKTLLTDWVGQNLTLAAALEGLPARAAAWGLTSEEAARLRPPAQLPAACALRWNEPLYPRRLHSLPLKLRPALLFYVGDPALFMRPLVYFNPDPLSPEQEELLRELISLLLGEYFLPAAFCGTPPAALLLEELATSEGELLLFAQRGLAELPLTAHERALLTAQRLIITTPLPPETPPNPAWEAVLSQVALTAADSCIAVTPPAADAPPTATLLLSPTPPVSLPAHIHPVADPAEALLWLTERLAAGRPPVTSTPQDRAWDTLPLDAAPLGEAASPEPPPPPAEMLRLLEAGGRVPEALRKRLLERTA